MRCGGCDEGGPSMKNDDHEQEESRAMHGQQGRRPVQSFGVQDCLFEYKYPSVYVRGSAHYFGRALAAQGSSEQLAFVYSDGANFWWSSRVS